MKKILSLFIFAFLVCGCAVFQPFKPGQKVQPTGNFFNRSFTQNGQRIDLGQLTDELKRHEKTKADATSAQYWRYAGFVLAGVGGYVGGYNLTRDADSSTKQQGFALSIGLIGLSGVAAYYSDKLMVPAVQIYNKSF